MEELRKADIERAKEESKRAVESLKLRQEFDQKYLSEIKLTKEEELKLLDEAFQRYKEAGVEEVKLKRWYEDQKRAIEEQYRNESLDSLETNLEAQKNNYEDLFNVINAQYTKHYEYIQNLNEQLTWDLKMSFSSLFSDFLVGELNSFTDFFASFGRKLQRIMADRLSDMLADWIFSTAQMKATFGGGFGGFLGSIGALFGLGARLPRPALAEIGTFGGRSFQKGTDFVPSTGWYILHRGEKVIPAGKEEAKTITIINTMDPKFISAAIAQDPDTIVNIITEDLLRNGATTKIIKRVL